MSSYYFSRILLLWFLVSWRSFNHVATRETNERRKNATNKPNDSCLNIMTSQALFLFLFVASILHRAASKTIRTSTQLARIEKNIVHLDMNRLEKLGINKENLLEKLRELSHGNHVCSSTPKKVTDLSLHFIQNRSVTCNDGSKAG